MIYNNMPFTKNDPNINRRGRIDGGGLNLTNLLKTELEKIPEGEKDSYKVLFVKALLRNALIKNELPAFKLILNYVDGLPTQTIGLDSSRDAEIQEVKMKMKEMFK